MFTTRLPSQREREGEREREREKERERERGTKEATSKYPDAIRLQSKCQAEQWLVPPRVQVGRWWLFSPKNLPPQAGQRMPTGPERG